MNSLERERQVEDVLKVLANELECCQFIYDVTIDVGAIIQSNQIEALLSRLVEREHLIRQLQCFEEELRSLIAQWETWPEGMGEIDGRHQGMVEQIRSLMASVVSLDETHKNAVMDRKREITGELRRLREGQAVVRNYTDVPGHEEHVVDQVIK